MAARRGGREEIFQTGSEGEPLGSTEAQVAARLARIQARVCDLACFREATTVVLYAAKDDEVATDLIFSLRPGGGSANSLSASYPRGSSAIPGIPPR